jgi:Ca2+-binding RTX toxin-like protein
MATTPVSTTASPPYDGPFLPRFYYPGGPVVQVMENSREVTIDTVFAVPSPTPNVYTITGGRDAALFSIDPSNGYLVFIDAPDYETPRDRGDGAGNNTYEVEVTRQEWAGTAAQMLTVWVSDVDERPGTAPQTTLDERREVVVRYVTEADGTVRQLLSIPTRALPDAPSNPNPPDGFAIVRDSSGAVLLHAADIDGVGLMASGSTTPHAAAASLDDLLREIGQHSAAGSASQAGLMAGATNFLASLAPATPLLLQTIVPTIAPGTGQSYVSMALTGTPQDGANPVTALVIDARGIGSHTVELDHIGFAALSGAMKVGFMYGGGAGNQFLVADDAVQNLNPGEGNDIVHAGGGNDLADGGAGDDRLYGDAGNDELTGGAGNDWIDGGAGLDTARLSGTRADYTIRVEQGQMVVSARAGDDGTDHLINVDLLNFRGAGADLSVRGTITRMIDALEDRVATRVELDGWEAAHASGTALVDIAASLLEDYDGDDALTYDDFGRSLYENGAERVGNQKELYYLFVGLRAGDTRAEALLKFADSFEMLSYARFAGATTHIADTEIGSLVRMYDALFDRAPDAGGLNYWIGAFESGNTIATIADAFVTVAEGGINTMSDAQFIAQLYQSGLERTASAGEIAGWIKLMDEGALNRGDLLLGIADSAEMAALVGMMSTSIELA